MVDVYFLVYKKLSYYLLYFEEKKNLQGQNK